MADIIELKAEARELGGKGAARRIRREMKVPGVIYGNREAPETITIDRKTIAKYMDTGSFLSTVFIVDVEGRKTRIIPRDLQVDPVRDFPIHFDFLRLAKDAHITVTVGMTYTNEDLSPGLKRGGAMNIVRHDIEISCPADAIPESIEASLEGLDIGDSLHFSDITLPENVVSTISDRDFTLVSIASAMAEEVEEVEGEGEEGEVEDGEGAIEAEGDDAEKSEGGDE